MIHTKLGLYRAKVDNIEKNYYLLPCSMYSKEDLLRRKTVLEQELSAINKLLNAETHTGDNYSAESDNPEPENDFKVPEVSENQFRSMIENMDLGIIELDTTGMIKKAYPSFCKMYGYEAHELEGTFGLPLLPEEGIEKFRLEQKKRLSGQSNVYEFQLIQKNGERKWVLISGTPLIDKNGKVEGSIAIHLDITDRKKIEHELLRAKEVAEEALHVKEIFLANISHEMRTPVHAITGLSEFLSNTELNEEQINVLNNIKAASGHLIQLIDDLLILTRSGINEITLREERKDVSAIIHRILKLFSTQIKPNLELKTQIQIQEGNHYFIDELRLTQIIFNLLNNANKFTLSGNIDFSASVSPKNSSIDELHLQIADSGIGIPEDSIHSIFEPFNKGENNKQNEFEGSGLGLSIVKKLITLMNGDIQVVSDESGTTFNITLQLKKSNGPARVKETHELEHLPVGVRILAAEDNPINQLILRLILSKALSGQQVDLTLCQNGLEAIEHLKTKTFDIVLMDIKMPVMNGDEAIRIIRNELGLTDLPIIVLTANATEQDRDYYINLDTNEFLTKPFEQQQLIHLINKSLMRSF